MGFSTATFAGRARGPNGSTQLNKLRKVGGRFREWELPTWRAESPAVRNRRGRVGEGASTCQIADEIKLLSIATSPKDKSTVGSRHVDGSAGESDGLIGVRDVKTESGFGRNSIMKRFPFVVLFVAGSGAFVTGCAHVGPSTVPTDRMDDSEAEAESWKSQRLLNLVKIRHGDTPMFPDVGQIDQGNG